MMPAQLSVPYPLTAYQVANPILFVITYAEPRGVFLLQMCQLRSTSSVLAYCFIIVYPIICYLQVFSLTFGVC